MSHRDGLWDLMGNLQFDLLMSQGLKPSDKFLDVGCGPLRAGVKIIPYLDAGNYVGFEANRDLLTLAEEEIHANGLEEKMPRLYHSGVFEFEAAGEMFDVILAQSLFPHLDLNKVIYCCVKAAQVLKPEGSFFFTFFNNPQGIANLEAIEQKEGIVTFPVLDPYHIPEAFLSFVARKLNFDFEIVPYDHPHGQVMGKMYRWGSEEDHGPLDDVPIREDKKPAAKKTAAKKPATKKTPAKKITAKK